jgi:hypothetical protein
MWPKAWRESQNARAACRAIAVEGQPAISDALPEDAEGLISDPLPEAAAEGEPIDTLTEAASLDAVENMIVDEVPEAVSEINPGTRGRWRQLGPSSGGVRNLKSLRRQIRGCHGVLRFARGSGSGAQRLWRFVPVTVARDLEHPRLV